MNDRVSLSNAVKKIAWGYVLLHLHFNLGTIDILPDWVGYWMMYFSLSVLEEFEPSAKLLKPFGTILTAYHCFDWVFRLFGVSWDIPILGTLIVLVDLYFHFQLLTNLAAISQQFQCPETKKILTLRTVQTVLNTLLFLHLGWEHYEWAAYLILMIGLIVVIWICRVLFSLRRSLEECPDLPEEPESA